VIGLTVILALIAAGAVYDPRTRRRIDVAYVCGALAFIVTRSLSATIAESEWW
jgi:hypothetical protein